MITAITVLLSKLQARWHDRNLKVSFMIKIGQIYFTVEPRKRRRNRVQCLALLENWLCIKRLQKLMSFKI
jgi:hypothetical protein